MTTTLSGSESRRSSGTVVGDSKSRDDPLAELELLRRRVAELEAGVCIVTNSAPMSICSGAAWSIVSASVHDLDGNLLFVNPVAAKTLWFRPETERPNLRRFLSPSVESEFEADLERIRNYGVNSGHLRLVAKDGTDLVLPEHPLRGTRTGSARPRPCLGRH